MSSIRLLKCLWTGDKHDRSRVWERSVKILLDDVSIHHCRSSSDRLKLYNWPQVFIGLRVHQIQLVILFVCMCVLTACCLSAHPFGLLCIPPLPGSLVISGPVSHVIGSGWSPLPFSFLYIPSDWIVILAPVLVSSALSTPSDYQ